MLQHCTGKSGASSSVTFHATQRFFSGYSGFTVTPTVTCVEGNWIQPAITCAANDSKSDVIIYVSIDGSDGKGTSQNHLRAEKVATEAFCEHGVPNYSGWTNVDLAGGFHLATFAVGAHDHIWAQVRASGHVYKLTLADITTRQVLTESETVKDASRDEASWEVETEATGCPKKCVPFPLAKFEPFKFTGAEATIAGYLAPVDRWPRQLDTMMNGSRRLAAASKLGKGSFTETWYHQ